MQLFLIPTPLAPDTAAQVLPAQVLEVIKDLEVFFVEEVRTARRFISSLRLGKTIDELTFYELHKDTPETETRRQLEELRHRQQNAGVLSEAGCPGIADPGAVAVRIAHQVGIEVIPLVGPSSLLMALMASGLNGQSFVFHGYLPIERPERIKKLKQLEKEGSGGLQAQIFIETPYRNNQVLEDILAHCTPELRVCIACQVTDPNGFVKTRSVRDWKKQPPDLHKKPTVFIVG